VSNIDAEYNPYNILNVSTGDTINIITQKYRKLALKYHPDKNKNNTECEQIFKNINNAYKDILKQKNKGGVGAVRSDSDIKSNNININDFTNNLYNSAINLKEYIYNFKNLEINTMINNLLKELDSISDYYQEKNFNIKNTEDLYINANIELFDIYNNVEKTININRFRKCPDCHGYGLKILKNKNIDICGLCKGIKYIEKNVELKFKCKYKMKILNGQSDQIVNMKSGSIIINIIPKYNNKYDIINYYDLLYTYYIHDKLQNILNISFKHLDNKTYSFNIYNPILNYRYKIDDLGLLYMDENKRGVLYIILQNKTDMEDTYIK